MTPTPVTSLVIDKVVMNSTPQSGTWLMCFMANAGSVSNTFNVPDRTYQGDGIEIYMNLKLTPVSAGTTVNFRMHLDDDQADVCAGSAEDQTSGSFPAGTGSRSFTDHDFKYVVHYHIS